MPHRIEQVTDESTEGRATAAVSRMLLHYNVRETRVSDYQSLTLVLRDEQEEIVGGLVGETFYGWLFVKTLVLEQALRRQSFGSQLLARAEAIGRERGCAHAYLDTFSFQALPFYEKRGYSRFGTLEDFPPGQSRYFLQKKL